MKIEKQIREKLIRHFKPVHLVVENESSLHAVPENSETHFKILIVSDVFKDNTRLERQQLVYSCLKEELNSGVHALSQRVYSLEEWDSQKNNVNFVSPECLGGGKPKFKIRVE